MTNEELYAWRDVTLAKLAGNRGSVKPSGTFRSVQDCAREAINAIVDMAVAHNQAATDLAGRGQGARDGR